MAIHNNLPQSELHEPLGVATAALNQVYVTDGLGSGTFKTHQSYSNLVVVEALADFPTPVSSQIALVDGTFYVTRGVVDVGVNRFTLAAGEQASMAGFSQFQDGLTYSGTAPMFTITQSSMGFRDMQLNCVNAKVVQFDNVAPAVNNLTFEGVNFSTCTSVGDITDVSLLFFHTCQFQACSGAKVMEFFGTNNIMLMTTCIVTQYAVTLFALGTATFLVFKVTNTQMIHPAGNAALTGAAASANILAGGRGSFVDNESFGAVPVLVNITDKDLRWKFIGSNIFKDSTTRGMLHFSGNTDATVISTADTYTEIDNGTAPPTFALDVSAARVTQPTNNSMNIEDEVPFDTRCQANVSVRTVSGGGDKVVTVAIFESVDDGVIYNQVSTIESSALVGVSGGELVVTAPITAQKDYRYQVRIKNETDTTNLEVISIQFYLG